MLPDLTFLLALILGLSSLGGKPDDSLRSVLGSALCFIVGGALCRMSAARGLRAIDDDQLPVAEAAGRWATLWPFVAWFGALWAFQWGSFVDSEIPRLWWITRYAVLLAPMIAVFGMGWAARAEIQAELITKRGGIPVERSTFDAVMAGLRRNALVLVPLLGVLSLIDALWIAGELGVESLRLASLWIEAMPLLSAGFMMLLILGVLPFIPKVIARMVGAEPMAPGHIRSMLERAAAKIDLEYGEIMVWRTKGRMLNAMVVGFTKRSRIIFMTDGLLDALPEEELLAVFFHEAGHAKKNHLPLFMVMFFSLSLMFDAMSVPLQAIGFGPEMQLFLHLGILWFGLLGWVSRRFERESDIYGAEHAAVLEPDAPDVPLPGLARSLPRGAAMMVRALDRIRVVAGHVGGHRHGTIEDRMAFVTQHALDPDVRDGFRGTMRTLKLSVLAFAIGSVVVTGVRLPEKIAHASAQVNGTSAQRVYMDAMRLEFQKPPVDAATRRAQWQRAYDGFVAANAELGDRDDLLSTNMRFMMQFAAGDVAIHGLHDPARAKQHFTKLLDIAKKHELHGMNHAISLFEAHIELGRIAAWAYAALPVGDPRRVRTTMDGHLAKAHQLRRGPIAKLPKDRPVKKDKFLAERLRLLSATIAGALGETALARQELTLIASVRRTAGPEDYEQLELAADAERELARLGAATAEPKDG